MNVGPTWPSPEAIHTIAFDVDGVFTDNKVYVGQDGFESVRCDRAEDLSQFLYRLRPLQLSTFRPLAACTHYSLPERPISLAARCPSHG